MKIVEYFRRVGRAPDRTVHLLDATVQGIDNQSRLLNEKLEQLIEGMNSQSRLLNDKLMAMIDRQNAQIELHKAEISAIRAILTGDRGGIDLSTIQIPPVPAATTLETALAHLPLMIDAKTYNTSHPDYDSTLVRNFPSKIFNADKPCGNRVYASLRQFARGDQVPGLDDQGQGCHRITSRGQWEWPSFRKVHLRYDSMVCGAFRITLFWLPIENNEEVLNPL
jgi:hypothetical protein